MAMTERARSRVADRIVMPETGRRVAHRHAIVAIAHANVAPIATVVPAMFVTSNRMAAGMIAASIA